MKRKIAISLLLICSISVCFPQIVAISGRVIDEKKAPIERAYVSLRYHNGGRIVAYALTSVGGEFSLKKDIRRDSMELNFSCMGYAPQTLRVPNNNQPIVVEMAVKSMEIREVIVNAQKITQRRDTITYRVASFSSAEDRTIGDVLKRLPGIEVLETGEIKYQGQKLDKFYIEGSDMLGGRYGLATNNISHKDVANIEVMENHQPIKALQDMVFSGSTAMNIKLKEDAKSRWAGTIKGGLGVPQLWTAELFAMRFKSKVQSLNTYKGNNTGNESSELNLFTPSGDFASNANTSFPTYIDVSTSVAGDIGTNRSIFNQTHTLSSNNLFKVGKDYDLVTELTASFKRLESEYASQSTYFLADEKVSIEDKTESATNFKRTLDGKLRLKANKDKYYLNNELNFSYDQNDTSVDIFGTYTNNQSSGIKNYTISNDFDILQRYGEKFFTFRSNNEYSSKSQILEVTKNDKSPIYENIGLSSFYTNNSLDYSIGLGKFRLNTPVGLLYQYKQMENELDSEFNNLTTHKLRFNVTPSFDYNLYRFRFSLSANVLYQTMSLDNKWHHTFGVNPRFSMNWTVSSMFKVYGSASWSKDMPNENLFYNGVIMNNYRRYTAGYIDFSCGESATASVNLEYKDVVKSFFANLGVTFLKKINTRVSGQNFEDDYIIDYYIPGTNTSDMLSVMGSVSKGIEAINGTVTLSPLFSTSQTSILRNGVTIPYSSNSYSLRAMFNTKITANCNITYNAAFAYNKNKMEAQQYFSSIRFTESLKFAYSPLKSLQLSCNADHYCNELTRNNYKNFIFLDFTVSYLPGNSWELTCGVKNILDEKYYSYYTESELSTFYKSYKIRPRNILLSATFRF